MLFCNAKKDRQKIVMQENMNMSLPIDENRARIELAALFRLAAKEGLHEGISNHFSYALDADGKRFLMNPYGIHFSQIKASDLLIFDADAQIDTHDPAIDITAWSIHGAMHRTHPAARCLVHLHPHYATALLSLEKPDLPAIDQTSARFHNRLSWDTGFDGMGIGEEGERLAQVLGNHKVLMMGQHGIMVAAQTPALAWDITYHLERACKNYMTALSSGRKLAIMDEAIAEKTAQQWHYYDEEVGYQAHLNAMMAVLDREDSSYRE